MSQPLTRNEVPVDQTWNLDDLFATREAWLAEVASVESAAEAMGRRAGRLGDSAGALMACLDARDELRARLQRAYLYASLGASGDGTDARWQADLARADRLSATVDTRLAFVDSEILALPDGTVERFLADLPPLAVHRTDLDDLLATKPHRLGAESEQLLAALGEVLESPYLVYRRAKMGDMRFEPFAPAPGAPRPNSFNLYEWTYETHPDTAVRRAAWKSFCDGLVPYQNTFAATFATEVTKNVALARQRRYPSAEHFLLHTHKVPFELYASVVENVQAGLAPHMRRYAALRRHVLGLDKLLYCDIKAPLDHEYAPAVSFEEAGRLIVDAVAPMGEEYQALVRSAFERRWIDRCDNVGKSSGAFCATAYGVHSFVLVTWSNAMRDAFVLAHELGHMGHFMLAGRHQRFSNTRCAMPFVEAPSIMNELLLARHILAGSRDVRMRRWVIMQLLGTYHHNFVTHLLEAELQRQTYALAEQGEAITAAVLNERKRAILQKFWGDAVEIDDGAAMTWMRQPHYYFGLYPYTYSVGLVAATAFAEKARQEGSAVFGRWVDVLRAGGTMKPLALMQAAGIDLSTDAPVTSAVAYVGSLVDELVASF